MRLHAGVEPELSGERPDRDLHAGADAWPARLGELDQPVALSRPEFVDHAVGDMRGAATVHDQPVCTWRSVRGVPLKLDHDEAVAGKERRRDLDPTAAHDPLLAQAWEVDLEPGQPQEMQREPLLRQHVPRRRPVRHEQLLGARVRPRVVLVGSGWGKFLHGTDGAADGAIADRLAL